MDAETEQEVLEGNHISNKRPRSCSLQQVASSSHFSSACCDMRVVCHQNPRALGRVTPCSHPYSIVRRKRPWSKQSTSRPCKGSSGSACFSPCFVFLPISRHETNQHKKMSDGGMGSYILLLELSQDSPASLPLTRVWIGLGEMRLPFLCCSSCAVSHGKNNCTAEAGGTRGGAPAEGGQVASKGHGALRAPPPQ